MTLAFSTQLNKKPTFFVEKINIGLLGKKLIEYQKFIEYVDKYYSTFLNYEAPINHVLPKLHTIRHDEHERWKAGMNIHFVINNRTPNRYQFAPVIKCTSVQEINIVYWYNPKTEQFDKPAIYIDKKVLSKKQVEQLAVNDGFDNTEAFFAYFNTNFNGKIIHWTNTRY